MEQSYYVAKFLHAEKSVEMEIPTQTGIPPREWL